MNRVNLQPDGRLKAQGDRDIQDPLACLGHQVLLSEGCRLRTYFHLLERHPVLRRLGDFYSHLLEQYRRCPDRECRWQDFDCLELAKTVEMIGFPGKPRLEIYNTLHGVRGDGSDEIRSLAMEFLLDIPLRLGRLKHVIFGDEVDVLHFETVYTLFEFIDSIAWALSFHGTPARCHL